MNPLNGDVWEDKIKVALTEWMFRLSKLGQLKDFENRDKIGGFWVFECQEIIDIVRTLLEEEKAESFKNGFKKGQTKGALDKEWGQTTAEEKLEEVREGERKRCLEEIKYKFIGIWPIEKLMRGTINNYYTAEQVVESMFSLLDQDISAISNKRQR